MVFMVIMVTLAIMFTMAIMVIIAIKVIIMEVVGGLVEVLQRFLLFFAPIIASCTDAEKSFA